MKKRLLALVLIWLLLWSCLAFADSHQAKPTIWACDPGTIAYNCARLGLPMPVWAMPMWEGSGNKVYDYSGQRNNTDINGASWIGRALSFDGSDDYVKSQSQVDLLGASNDLTLFVRIKSGSTQKQYAAILDADHSGTLKNFVCHQSGNNINKFHLGFKKGDDSGWDGGDKETQLTANVWQNFLITKLGTKFDHYLDGIKQGNTLTVFEGILKTASYFQVGEVVDVALSRELNAIIDVLIFWSHGLTASQARTVSTNPFGMFEPIKWPIWNYSGAPPATFPQMIMVQ